MNRPGPPLLSRQVRHTLLALISGALVQRLALLWSTLLVAHALDLEELGYLAIGLQCGRLLGVLADAGPRAIAAREAAHRPREEALAWIAAARRRSAQLATLFWLIWCGGVWIFATDAPWFWILCGTLALPTVRDLKGLADALGATRVEVRLENLCALALLVGTLIAWHFDRLQLEVLAALHLGTRVLYAVLAELWLARRGRPTHRVSLSDARGGTYMLSLAQVCNQVLLASDVLLLGALGRAEAAGLYHAAQKIAIAAEIPLALLARLIQPHLAAAARGGDAPGALERVVRASAFLVLPVAAGGWIVAEALLHRLFGARFADAGWTLRWLLLASVAIHVGSRYGNLLFARREHAPYLRWLAIGMLTNLGLSLALIPEYGANGTSLATALAASLTAIGSAVALHRRMPYSIWQPYLRPIALALLVASAVLLVPPAIGVLIRTAIGACVFALGLWWMELRRGLRNVGAGLVRASGFERSS